MHKYAFNVIHTLNVVISVCFKQFNDLEFDNKFNFISLLTYFTTEDEAKFSPCNLTKR